MLSVEILGLPALIDKLNRLDASLDVEDILDESEALLLNRIRTRFLTQEDPDGNTWKPSQRALITGGKTLFKTGTLFHSIQAHTTAPNERTISTDVFYGPFHQFGTKRMVRRAFLGFNDEDLYLAERRVLQRVMEAIA